MNMRQIKFRGKSIYNNEWVYGNLRIFGERAYISAIDSHAQSEVHLSTVGQFTGLTDCKRNPIYEGDIFTVNGKYPKLVEYREDRAAFCIANVDELDKEWIDPWQQPAPNWWYDFSREIIVIGNIHDNPELTSNQPTEV